MSAKKKSSDSSNQAASGIDPELEKKVDALLSVEEPDDKTPELPKDTSPPQTVSIPVSGPEEVSGAPLLPTDKLPDLDKKKQPEPAPPTPEEPQAPAAEPAPEAPIVEPSAPEETASGNELNLEDPDTSQAVDDIVASEADSKPFEEPPQPAAAERKPVKAKSKGKIWRSKALRKTLVFLLLLGLAAAAVVPSSRYFLLNTAGVRAAASMRVLDETTGQPLKNAQLSVAGQSAKTDEEGNVRLEDLKLGKSALIVSKPAFAEINQPHVIGWGSNPLGEFRLKAVGAQYKFEVTDFLSDKPLAKVQATSGEAAARSNEKGEIVLTVPETEEEKIEIEIKAEGFRTEKRTLSLTDKDTIEIKMVPARKHLFISKRTGTYDVYKIDVDGKNEEKVLAGTGSERSDGMALAAHPTKDIAALVSTRDRSKTINGSPASTLTLIDLASNSASTITQSERIQLIDWSGGRLVYVKIGEGENTTSATRHRLMSYDLEERQEKELASSNYFNDIVSANNAIYFSPAAYNVNGSVGLYKISADGGNKKTVYDKEVWNLLRTDYDKLSVSMGQEWFDLDLSNDSMKRAESAPSAQKTRIYVDSPDNLRSLWIDERDGKGVILEYKPASSSEEVMYTQGGLKYPLRWISSDHIVYRVDSNSETADYVYSIDGNKSQKIRDVTDTAGIDRWYYY